MFIIMRVCVVRDMNRTQPMIVDYDYRNDCAGYCAWYTKEPQTYNARIVIACRSAAALGSANDFVCRRDILI